MKLSLVALVCVVMMGACSTAQRSPSSETCKQDGVNSTECQDLSWKHEAILQRR